MEQLVTKRKRTWDKKQVDQLTDFYVRKLLFLQYSRLGLNRADINSELIKLKRKELRIRRVSKDLKNQLKA